MTKRPLPEVFGMLSPFLAVLIALAFTAHRELELVNSPLVLAAIECVLLAAAALLFGMIGVAVATLLLTLLIFIVSPAHSEGMQTAFELIPLAGWVAIAAVLAQRLLSGWRRRKLAGTGNEIRELRTRIAQLEALSTAGSIAEVLGAASIAWRSELKTIVECGGFIISRLPQGLRDGQEARRFEAALRAASAELAALEMLSGGIRFEVQQEAQLSDAVRRAVERTHDLFERLGLTVEFDLEEGGVPCAFDMELMVQALVNLLVNAAEASGAGGKVTVRAVSDFRGERGVIEIADRGSGINSDVMPYVFKPFFTTKSDHLGLGLAVAREIIARMGGSIAVAANETRGVTFRVRMPMKRAELVGQTSELARARKEATAEDEPVIPQEKILHHIKRLQQNHEP